MTLQRDGLETDLGQQSVAANATIGAFAFKAVQPGRYRLKAGAQRENGSASQSYSAERSGCQSTPRPLQIH
jgi:hypothetical protein